MAEFREAAASIVRGGTPELRADMAQFVRAVFDLEQALQLGITVTMDEITELEFRALIVVREQRAVAEQQAQAMAAARERAMQAAKHF